MNQTNLDNNQIVPSSDTLSDNTNMNLFCSTIPAYTHCKVSSDSATWNDFCAVSYKDETPAGNWMTIASIVFVGVAFLVCVGCIVLFCVVVRRKGKKIRGYVPLWSRSLNSNPDAEDDDDFLFDEDSTRAQKQRKACC